MRRVSVPLLVVVLAGAAFAPLAEAVHYPPWYAVQRPSFGPPAAAFEAGVAPEGDKADNRNGPAGSEYRAIPTESDVPARFRGLADTLSTDAGARGLRILDHRIYGSAVEAGAIVPYGGFLASATDAPRTPPTSMHFLWHGYWIDQDADGVIEDVWCANTNANCGGADEFEWRGEASGEALVAYGWILPGDYQPGWGTAGRGATGFDPSGFGGHCDRYGGDNAACVSPTPDFEYEDNTAYPSATYTGWRAGNGGGQWTAEEFLVVSQHVVSIIGPRSLVESGPYGYQVDCAIADGCMRDYDWTQSAAYGDLEGLYLGAMRVVRDHVFVPVVDVVSSEPWNVCPRPVCWSSTEHAHLEAVAPDGATQKAWARAEVATIVPAWANTPSRAFMEHNCARLGLPPARCLLFPEQGFYGDFMTMREPLQPHSSAAPPALLRPLMTAFLWEDANGDGYIGAPGAEGIAKYQAGLSPSPNDPACWEADSCEVAHMLGAYLGGVSVVTPGPAGWPPGSFVLRDYQIFYNWNPLAPNPRDPEALVGDAPATLRNDPDRCRDRGAQWCGTLDAILVPTGSLLTLHGESPGTVRWTEHGVPYAVHFAGLWTASA